MKSLPLVCVVLAGMLALGGCHLDSTDPAENSAAAETVPTGTGSATVSWEAPTTTTTGAALTDLAGYRIYYGTSETDLSQVVALTGVGTQTYVIDNLGTATWYFAVKAVTSVGVESPLSEIVSKSIS